MLFLSVLLNLAITVLLKIDIIVSILQMEKQALKNYVDLLQWQKEDLNQVCFSFKG